MLAPPRGHVNHVLWAGRVCVDKWDLVQWAEFLLDGWDPGCHNPSHSFSIQTVREKNAALRRASPLSSRLTKPRASAENRQIMHNSCLVLFFDTDQDLPCTVKLMVHFNIPSLWKAGDLFHLCHFTCTHTYTSFLAPQQLLLKCLLWKWPNMIVLMCWMAKPNALLNLQLMTPLRRDLSSIVMGYGCLFFLNTKPFLFAAMTSFCFSAAILRWPPCPAWLDQHF